MQQRSKARLEKFLKSFLIFSLVTLTMMVFVVTFLWNTLGDTYQKVDRINDNPKNGVVSGAAKDVLDEPIAILLLGVDSNRTDMGRSDTIMVMVLKPEDKSITVVSLPRDTYTEIAGKGYNDKVNHSMVYGIPTVLATVENFFGIRVDYYATIDFKGFEKAIDTLGGIKINVDERMKYTDVAGGLYIDLQPGLQVLDGEQALGYARFRKDSQGDLGRIARQQEVIKAVLDKSTDIRSAAHIFELMDIVGEHFKTDITSTDIVRIAATYRNATSGNLSSVKVNGVSKRFGEQNLWYYVVDDQEREKLHEVLASKLNRE